MDDLGEKLGKILNDPESVATIAKIIGNVSNNKGEAQKESVPESPAQTGNTPDEINASALLQNVMSSTSFSESEKERERIALVGAIRPFLDDGRKKKADGLIKALRAASFISRFKNTDILKLLDLK